MYVRLKEAPRFTWRLEGSSGRHWPARTHTNLRPFWQWTTAVELMTEFRWESTSYSLFDNLNRSIDFNMHSLNFISENVAWNGRQSNAEEWAYKNETYSSTVRTKAYWRRHEFDDIPSIPFSAPPQLSSDSWTVGADSWSSTGVIISRSIKRANQLVPPEFRPGFLHFWPISAIKKRPALLKVHTIRRTSVLHKLIIIIILCKTGKVTWSIIGQ